MKQSNHVFLTLEPHELEVVVHDYLKRKGILKEIPKDAEYRLFDSVEVCIEYMWGDV